MKKINRFLYEKKVSKVSGNTNRLYLIMRSKFLLVFFIFVFVPVFLFGAFMQVKYIYLYLDSSNKNLSQSVENYISKIENTTYYISEEVPIEDLIFDESKRNDGRITNEKTIEIAKTIEAKYESFKDVDVISAYYIGLGRNSVVNLYNKLSNPVLNENKYAIVKNEYFINNPDEVKIIGTSMQFYGNAKSLIVLTAAKAVRNQKGEVTGIIYLDYDLNGLERVVDTSAQFESKECEIYIIDQNTEIQKMPTSKNSILYCNKIGLITSKLQDEILSVVADKKPSVALSRLEEKGANVISQRSISNLSWKLIVIYPFKTLVSYSRLLDMDFYLVLLGVIFALAVFSLVVRKILLKPIKRLTTVISELQKGSYPTHTDLESLGENEEEVKNTNENMNFDNLINRVYYNRFKQQEAELSSLQSKINPHFLYNTLESIRGAALYHGIDSIAQMAKSLSLLFRYSISNNMTVTVREELDNLNNYVTIQNFRHDDKFNLEINIPEKVYEYKILKLILQPIVENSIKHGLEMKMGKGKIRVSIFDYGSLLKIEVSDNGEPIHPDRIKELNRRMDEGSSIRESGGENTSNTGIGLQNVNSRIKLYFGKRYGVKFCEDYQGVTVEVMLPVTSD